MLAFIHQAKGFLIDIIGFFLPICYMYVFTDFNFSQTIFEMRRCCHVVNDKRYFPFMIDVKRLTFFLNNRQAFHE